MSSSVKNYGNPFAIFDALSAEEVVSLLGEDTRKDRLLILAFSFVRAREDGESMVGRLWQREETDRAGAIERYVCNALSLDQADRVLVHALHTGPCKVLVPAYWQGWQGIRGGRRGKQHPHNSGERV